MKSHDPDPDTVEILCRKTLEEVLQKVIEWLIKYLSLDKNAFDHFVDIDKLLWHEGGWNLHDAIFGHFMSYNRWRIKANLCNAINRIVSNESLRLCVTSFDEWNNIYHIYKFVHIDGANGCGHCGDQYGDFLCGSNTYILPPYHDLCECYAEYYNDADLII